jgi:hypothetical protein
MTGGVRHKKKQVSRENTSNMHSQIAEVVNAFEHAQSRFDHLVDSVPDDRWAVRSDPARWSVAECVAHLNLTNAAYVPRIRKAIEEARQLPRMTGSTYSRDVFGKIFATMVGPLPRIGKMRIGRVKTTAEFVPTGNFPRQELLAEFKRLQLQLIGMVKESDGLAIDKVKITSPFGEKIHYSVYSTYVILPRHEERHIQQAELVWA